MPIRKRINIRNLRPFIVIVSLRTSEDVERPSIGSRTSVVNIVEDPLVIRHYDEPIAAFQECDCPGTKAFASPGVPKCNRCTVLDIKSQSQSPRTRPPRPDGPTCL